MSLCAWAKGEREAGWGYKEGNLSEESNIPLEKMRLFEIPCGSSHVLHIEPGCQSAERSKVDVSAHRKKGNVAPVLRTLCLHTVVFSTLPLCMCNLLPSGKGVGRRGGQIQN